MTQFARKDPWIIGRRHQKDFLLGRPGGAQQFKTRMEDGDKKHKNNKERTPKLKTQEQEEEEQEEQQHEEEEQQGNNYQTIS